MSAVIECPPQPAGKLLDRCALQKVAADLDERMGFVPDPTATAEMAKDLMLARGIRPEDRILSREILRARHENAEE